MSPKAFHVHIGLLVCCKIGWRQLDFSWAYPFTGRYSKEREHINYLGSTLEEDGELDAEASLSVQNG